VNNTARGQGQDIRCESSEKMYVANSIITGANGDVPHIYMNGNNRKIISDGYNVLGNIGKSSEYSEFTTQASDFTDIYYGDIFETNVLADNGGYPQTVALASSYVVGATVAELNGIKTNYQLTADVTKDQRGFSRNTAGQVSIGAYEYGASAPSGINTPQAAKYFVYPAKFQDNITVAGAEGAHISIVNISGMQLYLTDKAKNIEYISTENYPKGVYLVVVNGKATKIIK
jgi:hypothetical protein